MVGITDLRFSPGDAAGRGWQERGARGRLPAWASPRRSHPPASSAIAFRTRAARPAGVLAFS
ncbi:hypothetical protein, partial [Nonomuraea dietziae]|uniref:hypothetical protein n=1 Tax=Nonomuraea dietziae TaxID=65515 RepID=UPI0034297D2A